MTEKTARPSIFVLMPFDRSLDNVYFAIQQAAAAINANVERADRPVKTEQIMARIYAAIEAADLITADLTGQNPNVFYEVGYAHASGKPVSFLAQDRSDVPFDLRNYPILEYSLSSPVPDLITHIKEYFQSILPKLTDSSPLRQPLEEALRAVGHSEYRSHLYKHLLSKKIKNFDSELSQWVRGTMRVGPDEVHEKGTEILNQLSSEGFATLLVPVGSYWMADTDYLEAARRAAQTGKKVVRVFLVFDPTSLETPVLRECIEMDEAAGIKTWICLTDRLGNKEAIRDFGIWDDEVLCAVDVVNISSRPAVTGCEFTTDIESLHRARRWKDSIMQVAEPAVPVLDRYRKEADLHQPLMASADLMRSLGEVNCKGSYVDLKGCDWYHTSWQFLRIVDVVSTPDWHRDFYARKIADAAEKVAAHRALICGAADYCMLAHLLANLPGGGRGWEIVVLDLCATPLKVCEWFAEKRSIQIQAVQGDARNLHFKDGWFGIVVTDAFLSRLKPEERKDVVQEWKRVLVSDGHVITTVRLGKGSEHYSASQEEIERFVAKARRAAFVKAHELPCSVDDLERRALAYAQRMTSLPPDEKELTSIFDGFQTSMELGDTPGEFKPTLYARIVARKPSAQ